MQTSCERREFPPDFPKRQNVYFGSFALTHMEQMRKLQAGGLLGRGSEGWKNVAEHNLMAGVLVDILAELLKLPREQRDLAVSEALIHDDDKRGQKEAINAAMVDIDPSLQPQARVAMLRELEGDKFGLRRVTGIDLRDFDGWSISEMILRYADSNLATAMFTSRQASGPYSKDGLVEKETIVDWRKRLARLSKRNPEYDQTIGNELYGGIPLFTRLAEITETIEARLHVEILKVHPELAQKYSEPCSLNDLLRAKLYERIANTPLRTDSSKH